MLLHDFTPQRPCEGLLVGGALRLPASIHAPDTANLPRPKLGPPSRHEVEQRWLTDLVVRPRDTFGPRRQLASDNTRQELVRLSQALRPIGAMV